MNINRIKKKFLLVFQFIIFLTNCNYTSVEIVDVYKNGNVKEKKIRIDSNKYIVLKYYENGDLKDSTPFVNSLKNGVRKFVFKNEGYINWVTYQNDSIDGLVWAKYNNGNLYYKGKMKKDTTKAEEWFFFNKNGTISSYQYFIRKGLETAQYIRNYDNLGNFIESEGRALIEFTYVTDSVSIDKPYYFEIVLATPPNCKSIFFSFDKDSSGKPINRIDHDFISNPLTSYFNFKKLGQQHKYFMWAIKDTITGQIEKETDSILVFVLPPRSS
jgi:hypothetical protein